MAVICLAGQYHAAEERITKDGRPYLWPICNHRHMRKAEAAACAAAIAAGEPESAHWQNLAKDDLQPARDRAALGIAVELWQKLKEAIARPPQPEPPAPPEPPALNPNRPRPVAELSAWSKSNDAAFYLIPDNDDPSRLVYMRQDEAARKLRAKFGRESPAEAEAEA